MFAVAIYGAVGEEFVVFGGNLAVENLLFRIFEFSVISCYSSSPRVEFKRSLSLAVSDRIYGYELFASLTRI